MDLDRQIQLLIDNAPQDGMTPQLIQAIAPGLKLLARKLRHQYYILQNLEQEWVLTTLSNRTQPTVEKRIIYAFASLKDVSTTISTPTAEVVAVPIPVTQLLLQLSVLPVDSIVFFEPGNSIHGTEIRRADIQDLIQQLKYPFSPNTSPNQLPPDIA